MHLVDRTAHGLDSQKWLVTLHVDDHVVSPIFRPRRRLGDPIGPRRMRGPRQDAFSPGSV
jgi:hypothetical protein